ncbi:MAG: barstar family protein [Clostridia bacterium]|nr:barstar family protein [Clostridia bacterium]
MYTFDQNVVLDFREVQYYLEIHRIIKKALDFPEWYGENWDALWDCLTDIAGLEVHMEVLGLDTIRRRFPGVGEKLLQILRRWKGYGNGCYAENTRIFIIENGHERELTAIPDTEE